MVQIGFLGLSYIDYQDVLLNITLLIWLAVMYSSFVGSFFKKNLLNQIGLGLILSTISVIIISIAFEITEGFYFDSRSILIGLTGLFLGIVPTSVLMAISVIYRIVLGGVGMYTGIVLILLSGILGLSWRFLISKKTKLNFLLEMTLYSIVSGILPYLLLILMSYDLLLDYIGFVTIFYLVIVPIITFVLSLILKKQEEAALLSKVLKEQSDLLKVSINSPKVMEIFVLDQSYNYLVFNSYHQYCMKLYYHVDIKKGDSFLEYIKDSKMSARFKSQIFKAMNGLEFSSIDEVETTKGKYYESMFTPVRNQDNDVIGVAVFSYDVTKRKQYEINLEYLNYHDPLTNVYNRRYYNENIIRYDSIENFPLCLMLADIDSLKTVNDAFGHTAGDQMLVEVADALKNVVDDKGFVARIGGDEFIVLVINTSHQMAENIIEEIHTSLSNKTVSGVKISVSIGYDIIHQLDYFNQAFKNAEDNMYKNKLFDRSNDKNETINTIMKSLYEKNPREESHSQRVSKYCEKIGEALNLSKDRINLLSVAGILHDIGKIAIDDQILDKPGKLTDEEYQMIKKHPEIGYRILSASPQYLELSKDILHHHERYDGKGYPQGLKGENIPLNSRIISVADAYDAMIYSRPYRSSLTKEEAIKELKRCSGSQFDSEIVEKFIEILN
jgi:diguanylate cyclase (GGDEF)-like protein